MTRHVSILHRKPRTRRERLVARLHAVRSDARLGWRRLLHRRQRRAHHARLQQLFLQLGHRHPQAAPAVEPTRRARPHLRHPNRQS